MASLREVVVQNVESIQQLCKARPVNDLATSRSWSEALKKGKIFFFGHQEVEIGLRDIDWSGSHVAHVEWPAQLNRFFWLSHLATIYTETGDEELPRLARTTIEDWIARHSYGADRPLAPGDNTLTLSIRLGELTHPGWWGTVPAFSSSKQYDEEFLERMRASTLEQLAYLHGHLPARGNWRINTLQCLLFCGLVVPGAQEHVPFAVRHLNETFARQVLADGVHLERNPGYHAWMCQAYTRLWRLGRARPDLGLKIDTHRLGLMWDYCVYSRAPNGGSAGLHDSGVWLGGGSGTDLNEARKQYLEEAGLRGKDEWDLRQRPSRYFPCAGQVFLRESWQPESTFLVFDATRWGGGHCHLSRNSVSLYAGGRMLLHDPGSFSYEMSDPFAIYGRSTPAHNTINLEGASQSEANPDMLAVHIHEDLAVVSCAYEGNYWSGTYTWDWGGGRGRGIFGRHLRTLIWLKGRCALVFDFLHTDRRGTAFASHWQFPAGEASLEPARARAFTRGEGTNVLVQCLHATDPVEYRLYEGQQAPIRGWLPGHAPAAPYRPAPQFAMEGRTVGRRSLLCTLLLPFEGEQPPEFTVEALPVDAKQVLAYRLAWADGREDLVACVPDLDRQVNLAGPLESDGVVAAVALERGAPTRAFVMEGLFVSLNGEPLLEAEAGGTHWKPLR